MRSYFHGSFDTLPVGTILKGRGEEYKNDWSSLGPGYQLLEERRPRYMIGHHQGVFMCSKDDNNTNDYGLEDLDCCGGGTDYIYKLAPMGPVQRHDLNLMSEVQCLTDKMEEYEIDSDEYNSILTQIKQNIDNYWQGVPSENPVWEYITSHAEILEVHPYEEYQFEENPVCFLSEYQMGEYLELDDFMSEKRLKYVYPSPSSLSEQTEEYLCVFDENSDILLGNDNNDNINEYKKIIGVLVMGKNKNNYNVFYGISVDKDYQNQGIAKQLIDRYFQYSAERELPVEISSYTEEGSKYIKNYIENKLKTYPLELIKSKTKNQIANNYGF